MVAHEVVDLKERVQSSPVGLTRAGSKRGEMEDETRETIGR
ncbi:MAG: hypothetical protein ABIA62_05935 [Candidatus Woesearchaeota archaeon]